MIAAGTSTTIDGMDSQYWETEVKRKGDFYTEKMNTGTIKCTHSRKGMMYIPVTTKTARNKRLNSSHGRFNYIMNKCSLLKNIIMLPSSIMQMKLIHCKGFPKHLPYFCHSFFFILFITTYFMTECSYAQEMSLTALRNDEREHQPQVKNSCQDKVPVSLLETNFKNFLSDPAKKENALQQGWKRDDDNKSKDVLFTTNITDINLPNSKGKLDDKFLIRTLFENSVAGHKSKEQAHAFSPDDLAESPESQRPPVDNSIEDPIMETESHISTLDFKAFTNIGNEKNGEGSSKNRIEASKSNLASHSFWDSDGDFYGQPLSMGRQERSIEMKNLQGTRSSSSGSVSEGLTSRVELYPKVGPQDSMNIGSEKSQDSSHKNNLAQNEYQINMNSLIHRNGENSTEPSKLEASTTTTTPYPKLTKEAYPSTIAATLSTPKFSYHSAKEVNSRSTRSFKGQTRQRTSRKIENITGSENSRGRAANCSLGYFACDDGSCILSDRFCNSEINCPNGEDEPAHCTPCGQIYYGEIERTYELQVMWPRRNNRHSTCNITLVAAGGPHGDIVQIVLRKFSLGKFHSHTENGCPHGHMQIIENMRQYRAGYWCGDGVGVGIYYSETASVTVLLTRLKADNDLTAIDSVSGFYFKMAYKYLKYDDAVVRYGMPNAKKFTGVRSKNSFCHILFAGCDTKPCYIQSPNFPGLYPRNITCYYHITHKQYSSDKKALITLSQRLPQLINVKSSKLPSDTEERHLKLYDDCYYVGDYVRVYDGNSTKSPVLITFCRGAKLPDITSSGPNVLIEFTTSPYDSPSHETPWKFVSGFELVAKVKLVPRYNQAISCHEVITSNKNSEGWITSPVQSVSPKSTCVWELKSPPGYLVWIIFARYVQETQVNRHQTKLCETRLTIRDGSLERNSSNIATHCRDTMPRTCSRISKIIHGNSTVPPCGPYESYVTKSEHATIMQDYDEGSLVTQVRFLARYEFIDARQEGEDMYSPCSRIIRNNGKPGVRKLTAPKNVFLYGRGGRKSIQCSWLIQGNPNDAIKLTLKSIISNGSSCRTLVKPMTENFDCDATENSVLQIRLSEVPWKDVEVPRACICSKEVLPHTIESRGSSIMINMTILGMGPGDDDNNYNFDIEYEFFNKPLCPGGDRRLETPAGGVVLGSNGHLGECNSKPWLLEAPVGHSFLLTLPKATLANESCSTDSRLVLRTPGTSDTLVVVCPSAAQDSVIQLVWPPIPGLQHTNNRAIFIHDYSQNGPQLIAQWEPRRSSALTMNWLHLRDPRKIIPTVESMIDSERQTDYPCREMCQDLGACIATELWCDGVEHCPDGSDETVVNCLVERVPWLYLAMVVITLLILIVVSSHTVACRQSKQKNAHQVNNHPQMKTSSVEARRASTQESIIPPKDNQHHRLSAYTPDEYTDMDFETTV